jgi:hypothetical protein
LILDDEEIRFARTIVRHLDTDGLTVVLAGLLKRPVEPPSRQRMYRAKGFREFLGDCSPAYWADLKGKGKIPPGQQISPGIELWTEEQILATIVRLAEEEAARQEAERTAKAEAILQVPPPRPGPRRNYLKSVPEPMGRK